MKQTIKRRLKLLAAARLEAHVNQLLKRHPDLKLVAVGGSVGKTSTKLAIATVLKQKLRVSHHEGNYNDHISVPISILGLAMPSLYNPLSWRKTLRLAKQAAAADYPYDVILVEFGTDQPGDIPAFMKLLKPDIGVVTATTPEHMEFFKTTKAVLDEEFSLARGSKLVVLNSDDAGLKGRLGDLQQTVITYGQSGTVHLAGGGQTAGSANLCLGHDTIDVKLSVVGRHSQYALLAAAAVAKQLGLSPAEIAAGVAKFKPVPGRMNPLVGKGSSLIIDDSYNASPDAVIAALATLAEVATGRQIAVLGSMNELGDYAKTGHEQVGAACSNLDLLVTIGKDAKELLIPAAVKAGLKPEQIKSFMSPYEAGEWLGPQIGRGDTILVKGSQNGVYSEEATALLLRDSDDRSKLVRQTPDWLTKKKAQFNHE